MCRAPMPGEGEDTLESTGEVLIRGEGDNAHKIEHPETGSFFLPLADGKQQSGPRPRMVLADEIHEFASVDQIEIWQAAIAKIAGSAMMVLGSNTPAITQHVGTEISETAQAVARGDVRNETAFAFVARTDKADHETIFENEAAWAKSLPALGITYPIANIREEVESAQTRLSKAASVKRLYFGMPAGAADFWIDEEVWAAVQAPFNEEVLDGLKGLPCWLSLDLSQKNDLTALSATWKDGAGTLWQRSWYWTTSVGLAERATEDKAPYEKWVDEGWLTAVTGATIDKSFVATQVARLCAEQNVQELVFDPAKIADFETACEDIGFPVWRYEGPDKPAGKGLRMVAHAQGKRVSFKGDQYCMPQSIERYEDRILEGTIVIENSPVTYSCAANAAIDSDGQDNRCFDKKRSRGRIDGVVTGAMGVGAADNAELEEKRYEGKFFVSLDDDDAEEESA